MSSLDSEIEETHSSTVSEATDSSLYAQDEIKRSGLETFDSKFSAAVDPEIKTDSETKADTETKTETETKTDQETKAETEFTTETETKAEPEIKTEPETKINPNQKLPEDKGSDLKRSAPNTTEQSPNIPAYWFMQFAPIYPAQFDRLSEIYDRETEYYFCYLKSTPNNDEWLNYLQENVVDGKEMHNMEIDDKTTSSDDLRVELKLLKKLNVDCTIKVIEEEKNIKELKRVIKKNKINSLDCDELWDHIFS